MIKPLLVAVQFLTRLPVPMSTPPAEKTVGYSLLFYPLVGLMIGTLLIGLGWLLRDTPPLVAAALLLTGWVVLTGGLHLDGLADSADAWVGGMGDTEKILAIMKDPNCGPAGVMAILLVLLLKFVSLHSLFIAQNWIALLYATILARTLIPLLFLTTPYVRRYGLGAPIAAHQPRKLSIFVVTVTPFLLLLITGFHYFGLILTSILIFLVLRFMMMRRIHGTTGDTAGALIEIAETSVLLAAVLLVPINS
ncbi:adenosylcobinamide-GDP ribazoletransferase [Nitrosomonas sp. Is37]|uniref:adenosylcobinamide-GDP ribazoletransferase n=1 Tax=Nitrosomonas sp. Is37 TaxID=3080535 RepID=UPI00294AF43D|nr:adenosylcobinamide-GDP ribazoletransferase [Nitrosomonas sp. Is37]MDV6344662.1 adenosylcobinamide-GDP ribazoletransferase [Nitrosomonas sp. Is37]